MTARTAPSRARTDRISPDQIAQLREVLVAELELQRRHVTELQDTADALKGQTDSDSLLERQLAEQAAARALESIADIEHALAKIDGGTYGTCDRCGGQVAPARLEAIPHTRFCVGCSEPASPLFG